MSDRDVSSDRGGEQAATVQPVDKDAWWSSDDATLHLGDSHEVMASWPDECIDSIVTSPEYADQRKYRHGADTAPDAFAKHLSPFLSEMLRILRPTGSLMLNLGVIMRKGEESPYADEVLAAAREMGWKLLHRTIWHKTNPLPLSHPPYLTIAHEWVFWLAPTVQAYRGYDADTRTPHKEGSLRRIDEPYLRSKDERYARRGKTNLLHAEGARPTTVRPFAVGSTRGIKHPAPMPMGLAEYLVSLSCPPGGLVLDPFVGSGTTLLAGRARGRRGVGIDMTEDYLIEARGRLDACGQTHLDLARSARPCSCCGSNPCRWDVPDTPPPCICGHSKSDHLERMDDCHVVGCPCQFYELDRPRTARPQEGDAGG